MYVYNSGVSVFMCIIYAFVHCLTLFSPIPLYVALRNSGLCSTQRMLLGTRKCICSDNMHVNSDNMYLKYVRMYIYAAYVYVYNSGISVFVYI